MREESLSNKTIKYIETYFHKVTKYDTVKNWNKYVNSFKNKKIIKPKYQIKDVVLVFYNRGIDVGVVKRCVPVIDTDNKFCYYSYSIFWKKQYSMSCEEKYLFSNLKEALLIIKREIKKIK